MTRAELLESALDAVNKRPKAYGPPERNFDRIAALWTTYIDGKYTNAGEPQFEFAVRREGVATLVPPVVFDAVDVACMMVLMKVARLEETPGHMDSWTDIAGYAACGAECAGGPVIEHDADGWIEVLQGESFPPDLKAGDRVKVGGWKDKYIVPDGEYDALDSVDGIDVRQANLSRPRWYKRATPAS